MARPNKAALAKKPAPQTVTLREAISRKHLQQVEAPFLVVDPEKLAEWRKELEELAPLAFAYMREALTAKKVERNAGAMVQISRTVFEMLNILRPAPSFTAALVHEKTREVHQDRDALVLELLRGMDPERRQALVDEASEPASPDEAPPIDVIPLLASGEEPDPFEDL